MMCRPVRIGVRSHQDRALHAFRLIVHTLLFAGLLRANAPIKATTALLKASQNGMGANKVHFTNATRIAISPGEMNRFQDSIDHANAEAVRAVFDFQAKKEVGHPRALSSAKLKDDVLDPNLRLC